MTATAVQGSLPHAWGSSALDDHRLVGHQVEWDKQPSGSWCWFCTCGAADHVKGGLVAAYEAGRGHLEAVTS